MEQTAIFTSFGSNFSLKSKAILVNILSRVFPPGKYYWLFKGQIYLCGRLWGERKKLLNTDNQEITTNWALVSR